MDEALKERSKILDELLPWLFANERQPPEGLVKQIAINKALAMAPHKMASPQRVRAECGWIYEKYGTNMKIIGNAGPETPRCPISQSAIVTEWRAACGHVFEQASVDPYLQKNSTCPVFGCGKQLQKM